MIAADFKASLHKEQGKIGTFVKLANATAVEALGMSGIDFVIVDTEHAPCDQLILEHVIRAADCVNLPTIVRVSNADEDKILKALDLGASGVQIPGLQTVEETRNILRCTKYAPLGCRGLSFSQRSAGYGTKDKDEYMNLSNDGLINVVHIENKEMAEHTNELCSIDEIDVLFIGPMDISQSMGHPGDPGHPEVSALVRQILETCKTRGKPTGIFVGTPEAAKKYLDLGVSYIALSSEIGFMTWGWKKMLETVRQN